MIGKTVVTRQELLDLPLGELGYRLGLLFLLQSKGAPVDGTIYPRLNVTNYRWVSCEDPKTGDKLYEWERIC